MRHFGDVEAIKIRLGESQAVPSKPKFTPVDDPWLVAIVRQGQLLAKFVETTSGSAISNYRTQIRSDQKADGRVVHIGHPVRLNGGIRDAIELLETIDPVCDQFERRFEFLESHARFDSDDRYLEPAKAALNFTTTIIPRVRLLVHTYLWFLWIYESLTQASQFHGLLMGDGDFDELSPDAFPYISHPPIIVATIAAATMMEEVGATWVNANVEASDYDMDETSVSAVVEDIRTHWPQSSKFDFEKIEEYVIETRNDISHYVTKRGETIGIDELESYGIAVHEVISLVDALLSELVMPPIEAFNEELAGLSRG